MKKKFVVALLLLPFLFCGCESRQRGNTYELTRYSWFAKFDNGGEVRLKFDGERASLTLKNGKEQDAVRGRFIADDTAFVIFDRDVSRNFAFDYVPRGEKLDLTFEGNTIEMSAVSR